MRNSVKRLRGILRCVDAHTHLWCLSVLGGAILLCVSFFVEPSQREFLTVKSEGAQSIARQIVIEYSSVLGSLSQLGDVEVEEIVEAIPDEVQTVEVKESEVPEVPVSPVLERFYAGEDLSFDDLPEVDSPADVADQIPMLSQSFIIFNAQYSVQEIDALERLVECEAGCEDKTGKMLVADVVLNRMGTGIWGNDMLSVIEAPGQFKPVGNGAYKVVAATPDTKAAVMEALMSEDISKGAIYFQKSRATRWGNKEFLFRHGSHSFYK